MPTDILEKLQEDWLRLSRGSFDSVDCGLAANVVQEAIDEITKLRESHAHISERSSEADSYHKFWIEERSKRIAAEALAKLNTDARLRLETRLAEAVQNFEAIKQATIDGRVCDDIAWFDTITTLHDFCELAILNAQVSCMEGGK